MKRSSIISIIITSYNYSRYIEECITSCLFQADYTNFEVIVIDDGSTDSTVDIVGKYKNDLLFVQLENCGVEKASNCGMRLANGKYIVRVDADDRLESNYLLCMSKYFDDNTWDFLYSNYFNINENGNKIAEIKLPLFDPIEIRQRGDFLATGTIFRKTALEGNGLYNENVKNSGLENYELILNMLASGCKGCLVPELLFSYRKHLQNMSSNRRHSIIQYGEHLAAVYSLPNYMTNDYHPYGLIL